ncbi:hypothetical protein N9L68_04600 [bacterium]|nr:hypothetical protein [bacterium]
MEAVKVATAVDTMKGMKAIQADKVVMEGMKAMKVVIAMKSMNAIVVDNVVMKGMEAMNAMKAENVKQENVAIKENMPSIMPSKRR